MVDLCVFVCIFFVRRQLNRKQNPYTPFYRQVHISCGAQLALSRLWHLICIYEIRYCVPNELIWVIFTVALAKDTSFFLPFYLVEIEISRNACMCVCVCLCLCIVQSKKVIFQRRVFWSYKKNWIFISSSLWEETIEKQQFLLIVFLFLFLFRIVAYC